MQPLSYGCKKDSHYQLLLPRQDMVLVGPSEGVEAESVIGGNSAKFYMLQLYPNGVLYGLGHQCCVWLQTSVLQYTKRCSLMLSGLAQQATKTEQPLGWWLQGLAWPNHVM
ncbi:hypothetical protein ABBQ32_008882 [Trebouxia sp. C0010 RCD-2024]